MSRGPLESAPQAGARADLELEPRIVTIQELHVQVGQEEEFIARFGRLDVFRLAAEAADGALLEARLLQCDNRFRVVTSWSSRAGIDGWLESPARVLVRETLEPLYESSASVAEYQVRRRFPAGDDGR